MARIDYRISVTPIQAAAALEGKTVEAIEADVGKSVGGGNSSLAWAATDVGGGITILNWDEGTYTYQNQTDTVPFAAAASGDDGVFIRHTGKKYDASKTNNIDLDTANIEVVTLKLATTAICTLGAGDCIFIPNLLGVINIHGHADDEAVPAIEVVKLT